MIPKSSINSCSDMYVTPIIKESKHSIKVVKASLPFTYQGYLEILRRLSAADYTFASFTEAQQLYKTEQSFVLMRHDIDLDLEKALTMAKLENTYGIAATYFFLLRTEHYNVLSAEGSHLATQILDLGHHLGLHFDCAAYPTEYGVEELAWSCRREADLLQSWLNRPVKVVSYHRPGALVMSGNDALSYPLPHTYMPLFTKHIRYYSDSRGIWRTGDPTLLPEFKQGRPLQILIHPIWWNETPIAPYKCLVKFVRQKQESLRQSLAAHCVIYRDYQTEKKANETP